MSPPTFFSYARQDDWSSYLSRFFEDLEVRVDQGLLPWLGDTHLRLETLRVPMVT